MKLSALLSIAALALAGAVFPAHAQTFPQGTLKIVVPFSPGGATDAVARLISRRLPDELHRSVIVDYKPGAGTILGTDYVARSSPDGLTMGLVNSALTVNPFLHSHLPYDTQKDLRGVTQVVFIHTALVAKLDAPFNTVGEMLAWAKKNPGKLSYGSSGIGSLSQLSFELLKQREGLDIVTVPFKGGSQVVPELISGRIDIASDTFQLFQPQLAAGKIKMLGTFGDHRVPGYENKYPVIAETVPGLVANSIIGFVVPAATPDAAVHSLQAALARVLDRPDIQKSFAEMGMQVVASKPEAFDAFIKSELNKWGPIVKAAHLSMD
jgi:tripartite-type tricarboxylate transporter receptor subunit TctC